MRRRSVRRAIMQMRDVVPQRMHLAELNHYVAVCRGNFVDNTLEFMLVSRFEVLRK